MLYNKLFKWDKLQLASSAPLHILANYNLPLNRALGDKMSNEVKALEGIKKSFGTEQGEYGIDLFVSHHIEELPKSYWQKHLGTETPSSDWSASSRL